METKINFPTPPTTAARMNAILSDINIELHTCSDPVAREFLGKAYIELMHAYHLISESGYWRVNKRV